MDYSFFLAHPRARDIAERYLEDDADAAQLSATFRLYYLLRPLIPIALRQFLQSRRRGKAEGDWYLPAAFFEALSRATDGDGTRIIHPWPDGAGFGFVLTHDVETEAGLRNVEKIARIEEDLGFRSSWNVVPHKYRVDRGLLNDLVSRSFEIGIHGCNHDGRLFSSKKTFESRVASINQALVDYGAVGFRAPMAHRNLEWMQLLDIEYDSSSFDIDPYQAMPGGVGSLWPFVAGKFIEIPYTIPQDHTVFVVLGELSTRIWETKLDWVARKGGLALMVTHPDYLNTPARLDVYREFLTHVRERGGFWHALPAEAAKWWRRREDSRVEGDPEQGWEVVGPAASDACVARVEVAGGQFSIRRDPHPTHRTVPSPEIRAGSQEPAGPPLS